MLHSSAIYTFFRIKTSSVPLPHEKHIRSPWTFILNFVINFLSLLFLLANFPAKKFEFIHRLLASLELIGSKLNFFLSPCVVVKARLFLPLLPLRAYRYKIQESTSSDDNTIWRSLFYGIFQFILWPYFWKHQLMEKWRKVVGWANVMGLLGLLWKLTYNSLTHFFWLCSIRHSW